MKLALPLTIYVKWPYTKVDDAIDKAVGDFMKGKIKNID